MNSIDLIYFNVIVLWETLDSGIYPTAIQARSLRNQLIWRIIVPQQDNARCHIIKTAQEQAEDPDKGTAGHRLGKKMSQTEIS